MLCMPRACIRSPARPTNSASGRLRRIASISPAPSWSPDSSPTTMAMRSGRSAMSACGAGFSPTRKSPARRKASSVSLAPDEDRAASLGRDAGEAGAARRLGGVAARWSAGRDGRPACGFRHFTRTPPPLGMRPAAAQLRHALEQRVGALRHPRRRPRAPPPRPRPGAMSRPPDLAVRAILAASMSTVRLRADFAPVRPPRRAQGRARRRAG